MRFKFLHFKDDRLYLSREYIDTTDNEHIVTTAKNTIHTNQRTSTSTFVIMQGSKILGTVTQQRHTFFGQMGEYKFACLTGSSRFQGIRIDNFREVMVFVKVSTMLTFTLITYTGTSNLTQSIDVIGFNAQFFFNLITHILCPGFCTESPYFQFEFFAGQTGIFNGISQIESIRRRTTKYRRTKIMH